MVVCVLVRDDTESANAVRSACALRRLGDACWEGGLVALRGAIALWVLLTDAALLTAALRCDRAAACRPTAGG